MLWHGKRCEATPASPEEQKEIEELLSGVLNVATISAGCISSIGSGFVGQAASAISSIAVTAGGAIASALTGEGE